MQPPPGDGSGAECDDEDDDDEGGEDGSRDAATLFRSDAAAAATSDAELTLEERQATKLKAAAQTSRRKYQSTAATAVYWLGGLYEAFRGAVALSESASVQAASPVVFEVYGDEVLLFRRFVSELASVFLYVSPLHDKTLCCIVQRTCAFGQDYF
jgi:hypothetical protein